MNEKKKTNQFKFLTKSKKKEKNVLDRVRLFFPTIHGKWLNSIKH